MTNLISKKLRTLVFLILTPFLFNVACAQYSGSYEINSSGSGDFLSFTEAIDSLQSQGVSGAVTIEVATGSYNEHFKINEISGASVTNTIKFVSQTNTAGDVTIKFATTASDNYVVFLDSAKHITFSNVTITSIGTSYGTTVKISGSAKLISFDSCVFNGLNTSSTSGNYSIINASSLRQDSAISYTNSTFNNGSTAIYHYGQSSSLKSELILIRHNTFNGFRNVGIYPTYIEDLTIDSNTMNSSDGDHGIYMTQCQDFTIHNNVIDLSGNENGIYISGCAGTVGTPSSIVNNSISVTNTSTCRGIYIYNSNYVNLHFNSIYLGSTTNTSSYGLYIEIYTSNINSSNNILYNSGPGYALYHYGSTYFNSFSSDYNNLYSSGANVVKIDAGTYAGTYVDLSSYQTTGQDSNSLSINPYFTAFGDLHTSYAYLDNAGIAVSGITTDFDGDARNNPPCIGVDEFTGTAIEPMSGIYTIDSGGSGSRNFESFTAAIAALDTFGIDSIVEFVVASATYNERVKLISVVGSSSANTITFRSASRNASDVVLEDTLASGSDNYTLWIEHADHIVLKHITLKKSTASYSTALQLTGTVTHLTLDSCAFEGLSTTSTLNNYAIIRTGGMISDSNITITNSSFEYGSNSIYYYGNTSSKCKNVLIRNNTFTSFRNVGIYPTYIEDLTIDSNTMNSSDGDHGIYMTQCQDFTIHNNVIDLSGNENGIYISGCAGTVGTPSSIVNNSISVTNTSTCRGIYIYNSNYVNLHFNSIYLGSTTNTSSYGLYIEIYTSNINSSNNILYNSGPGYALYHYGSTYFNSFSSDYNNLYSSGANVVKIDAGTYAGTYVDLSSYQTTGQDSNSLSINPYFTAFGDLHTSYAYLDNAGIAVSGITTDFDGDARNNPPCIGVDEFTGTAIEPMSGIYTIDSGGSGSRNFESFTAAIAALDTFGIDSIVEFVVASATYNERVKLISVVGSSSANTITFRSASRNASDVVLEDTLASGSDNYTLWIEHADHIVLKHITLKKSTASYSTALQLTGTVTHLTLDSCAFEGLSTTSTLNNYAIIRTGGMISDSNITITNSSFEYGSNSIYYYGNTSSKCKNVLIRNNTFTSFRNVGIYPTYIEDLTIDSNTMNSSDGDHGIYMTQCQDFTIHNNVIDLSGNENGIYISGCAGTVGTPSSIVNNSISVTNTSTCRGIYIYNSNYVNLHFNSIYLGSTTNTSSYGLYIEIYTSNINSSNNILYNSGPGYALYHYGSTYFNSFSSDYNNLYSSGANVVKIDAGTYAGTYVDLSSYQTTGQDSNSLSINPYFTAFGDLHTSYAYLDNAGIAVSGITTDFDGDARNNPPCIGVDEFTGTAIEPMSGIYTIDSGGSGSRNFESFTAAIAALDTFGIDSIVEFVVASATYNERVKLISVVGSSSANTITFRSASRNASDVVLEDTLASGSDNYTLWIEHADHIVLKHITLKKSTASYSTALQLTGTVTHLTLDSCAFEGLSTTSTLNNYAIIRTGGMISDSNITITNSSFEYGSNSIYYYGNTSSKCKNVLIRNNTFTSFRNVGIYPTYIEDLTIDSNTMNSSDGDHGIYMTQCQDFTIHNNVIDLSGNENGIYISGCAGTVGTPSSIVNNSISVTNTSTCRGIYIYNSNYVNLHFNSIYLGSTTNTSSYGLYIEIYTSNINSSNNILYNSGPGYALYHYGSTYFNSFSSDYNNLYSSGANVVKIDAGTYAGTYVDLSSYQTTGQDSNSLSINPYFTAFGDLHAANAYLDGAGISITGISTDFESDTRDNPPCIGADEYAVPPISPMSGTYTIDSTGSGTRNFLSFSNAVAALDTFGIDGTVEFVVASNTYSDQVFIRKVNGASEANTITFRSAARNKDSVLLYTESATSLLNYTLSLKHADYFVFKNISIQNNTAAAYNRVISLSGTVTNFTIDSCALIGKSTTSNSNNLAVFYADIDYDSAVSITNSKLLYGSSGIYYTSYSSSRGTGLIIENDSIVDFKYIGVFVQYVDDIQLLNSAINSTLSSVDNGIYLSYCDYLTIEKNNIQLNNGSRGIYLVYCDGSSADKSLISNNFIYINASTSNGLYLIQSTYLNIFHNNVNLGTNTGTSSSSALVSGGSNNSLLNNIFVSNTGYAINLSSGSVGSANYNDIYTSGTNLGRIASTNYTSLANWQAAGQGANSISVDPGFSSSADLHVSTTDLYYAGDSSIKTIVPDDYDGDLRSSALPCIGADEFTPYFAHDVALYELITPKTECGLTIIPVKLKIKNTGNSSEDTMALAYSFNGGSLVYDTLFMNLGPTEITEFEFADSIDATGLSSFTFKVYTSLSTDGNAVNDTINTTVTNHTAWTHTMTNDTAICYGSNIVLEATGANYYLWSNGRTTNYNNVNIYSDVSYSVIMENLLGCIRYDTVNITVKARPSFSFVSETGYTNSYSEPDVGTSSTPITFKIKYTNSDNEAPASGYPYVQLDYNNNYVFNDFTDLSYGTTELDANDTVYTDGKVYEVTSTLPENENYHTRFYAVSEAGCAYYSTYRNEPIIDNDRVDLRIWANDISFSNINPDADESISISATIHNSSNYGSGTFLVALFEEDSAINATRVTNLPAHSDTTITWYHSFPLDEFYPMKVVVDTLNEVEEDNENNNFAIRPVIVGDFALDASITLNALFNNPTPCKSTYINYYGNAVYDSVSSTDKRVQGATVQFQINQTGATYQAYTNSNGDVSIGFLAPSAAGTYTISGTITDYTLISTFSDTFEVISCYNPYDIKATISVDSSIITVGDSSAGLAVITNIGDSTVYNFKTKAYSNFHGTILDTTIASLAPGASVNIPFVQVFSTIGTYSASIFTDYSHLYSERSESNNYGYDIVKVLDSLPDIDPAIYSGYTNNLSVPYNFGYTVTNHGGKSTGLFYIAIYDSTSSGKQFLMKDTVQDLLRCLSTSFSHSLNLDTTTCHKLIVEADTAVVTGGIVYERYENNNTDNITVCHNPPIKFPDLFTASGYLNVQPVVPDNPGDLLYLGARFFNCGNKSIPAGDTVRITYEVILAGTLDTTITEDYLGGMTAGAYKNSLVEYDVPPHGNNKLKVTLDIQDSINESNENNNVAEFPLCWDFHIHHLGSSGTHYVNDNVTMRYSYGNKGLYSGSNVKVLITIDDTNTVTQNLSFVSPTERQFKGYSSGPLPTNSFSHIFTTVGWHKVKYEIDAQYNYTECSENNNIDSGWIYISNLKADLRILSHMISPTELNPDTNELVSIYLSFENIGRITSDSITVKCMVNDDVLGSIPTFPGIEAGEDTTILVDAQWSDSVNRTSIIRGILDPDNNIDETDTLNNIASRAIIVGASTNLRIIDIDYDVSPCSNIESNRNVIVTVINEGANANQADIGVQFNFHGATSSIPSMKTDVVFEIGDTVVLTYTGILPPSYITGTSDVFTYGFITNVEEAEYNLFDNDYTDTLCTLDLEIITDIDPISCYDSANGIVRCELVYYKEYDGDNFIYSYRNIDSASAQTLVIKDSYRDTLTNLDAGTYILTAFDGSGRIVVDTFEITQHDALFTSGVTDSLCGGEVTLTIVGGAPLDTIISGTDTSYSYTTAWSALSPDNFIAYPSNQNLAGIAPGFYTVDVTDNNGCSISDTFNVSYVLKGIADSTEISSCAIMDSLDWTIVLRQGKHQRISSVYNMHPDSTSSGVSVAINDSVYTINDIEYSGRIIWIDETDTVGKSGMLVRLYYTKTELDSLISKSDSIDSLNDLIIHKYNGPNINFDISDDNSDTMYWKQLTPTIDSFDQFIVLEVQVNDFGEFFVSYMTDSSLNNTPVPIELLSFEAYAINQDALLSWLTASEINNSHFIVERSLDGNIWHEIAEVQGHGTSVSIIDYEYLDINAAVLATKVYYRLIQVDFDGTRQATEIRTVNFDLAQNLVVYPVPSDNQVQLLVSAHEVILDYELINLFGQSVTKIVLDNPKRMLAIDLKDLSAGTYYVKVKSDSGTYFKKIVKL